MNKTKIYHTINKFLDAYVIEGVNPQQFLSYLNTDEGNYKLIYHKVYRILTMEGISFESKDLTECLLDSIRDRIALINDLKRGNSDLPETIINQHPANTVNENSSTHIYTAQEIIDYITEITEDSLSDVPDYYFDLIKKADARFELKDVNIEQLLNSDASLKEYVDSNQDRYEDADEEPTYENLYNPIVIFKGEVIDGYNRTGVLYRSGDKTIKAYVSM